MFKLILKIYGFKVKKSFQKGYLIACKQILELLDRLYSTHDENIEILKKALSEAQNSTLEKAFDLDIDLSPNDFKNK